MTLTLVEYRKRSELSDGWVEARYVVHHSGPRTCVDSDLHLVLPPGGTVQGTLVIDPGESATLDQHLDRIAEHCDRMAEAIRARRPHGVSLPITM